MLTIGFFFIPSAGFACENDSKKNSTKKEVALDKTEADSCAKECCKKTNDSKNQQHNCEGKCSHSNCTTSTLQFSIPTSNDFEIQNGVFNSSIEKPISCYNEASISDGFTSIWLRPKI